MTVRIFLSLLGCLFLVAAQSLRAEGPGVSSIERAKEMRLEIDERLSQRWEEANLRPAAPATDAEFLRRLYLDLTGRIPSYHEVRSFMGDRRPDRRERLIDALLETQDHAAHLANYWRRILLPEGTDLDQLGGTSAFEGWLTNKFTQNAPYGEMVRELLGAEGRVTESGPVLFYAALELKPEDLAASTARVFLGMQIECAQCHDHPFDKWSQEDFWGYAAFFARISRPQAEMRRISPVLRVKDSNTGDVTLPDTEQIVSPRFPWGEESTGIPDASRRAQLAAWITSDQNPYFSRATANRVWTLMFGRGIVNPPDDFGEHNPPLFPELLNELADYVVESNFDLRQLIRILARTRAYQLSSSSVDSDDRAVDRFACMQIKTLTAEQLYDCLAMATMRRSGNVTTGNGSPAERSSSDPMRKEFVAKFRAPSSDRTLYQAGISQALTLMNGKMMAQATDLSSSNILTTLDAPFYSDRKRVETLFVTALARQPTDAERMKFVEYVTSQPSKQEKRKALGDILWALLNSAEFTLNH